jgi:hypothetical protein
MKIDDELRKGLNTALDEASFLDIRVFREECAIDLLLSVLALPEEGPEPEDPRVIVRLFKVGRIACSLRHGTWNDESAQIEGFKLDDLSDVVVKLGPCPIYGNDFIDSTSDDWTRSKNRLSCDESLLNGERQHFINLFKESGMKMFLELRIWFDDLEIYDMSAKTIPLNEFTAGGRRWWIAMNAKDERVQHHGIFPLKP